MFGDIVVDWSICEQPYGQILQTKLESKDIYSQQAYAWKSWLKRFGKKEVNDCPTILSIEGKTGSGRSSFLASIRKIGLILAPDLAFSAIVSFSELDEQNSKKDVSAILTASVQGPTMGKALLEDNQLVYFGMNHTNFDEWVSTYSAQAGGTNPMNKYVILLDDFDHLSLPDQVVWWKCINELATLHAYIAVVVTIDQWQRVKNLESLPQIVYLPQRILLTNNSQTRVKPLLELAIQPSHLSWWHILLKRNSFNYEENPTLDQFLRQSLMDLAYTPSLEKQAALFQTFSKLDEDDLKSRLQLLKQLNHLPSDSHSKNGIQKKAYHYVRSWQPIIQELSENFTLEERE